MSSQLAPIIDHTLLRPEATPQQIEALCREALEYRFASVCVNPWHVPLCSRRLKGSGVAVCTVIGFPLGAATSEVKAFEARRAVADGAREVDMVINLGALKAGDMETVTADIAGVIEAAGPDATVKVILECCLLTDEEKRAAVQAACRAGAHFVKTSTGFSSGGATEHDVALMHEAAAGRARVKASGGIRDLLTARRMVAAGASRLGVSAGVAIVQAERQEG